MEYGEAEVRNLRIYILRCQSYNRILSTVDIMILQILSITVSMKSSQMVGSIYTRDERDLITNDYTYYAPSQRGSTFSTGEYLDSFENITTLIMYSIDLVNDVVEA